MLNEQTITKMNEMKLFGMARGFVQRNGKADHSELSHAEFVGLLIDDEKTYRETQRLERLLKNAKFKQQACLEDIDYKNPRGLSKQVMLELVGGQWLIKKQNILITGPTGIGKSYIASALGNQACRAGYTTRWERVPRLFEILSMSKADASHLKTITQMGKVGVLILDDFGLAPLSDPERRDLLEIIEDRHGSCSTILTAQAPAKDWHEIIGEPTIADAICDRIFHNAYKIELSGRKSLRRESSETRT
jgi:DNA replication protein DnaC